MQPADRKSFWETYEGNQRTEHKSTCVSSTSFNSHAASSTVGADMSHPPTAAHVNGSRNRLLLTSDCKSWRSSSPTRLRQDLLHKDHSCHFQPRSPRSRQQNKTRSPKQSKVAGTATTTLLPLGLSEALGSGRLGSLNVFETSRASA